MRPSRRIPRSLFGVMALSLIVRVVWLAQFHSLDLEAGVSLPPAEMAHELLAGHGINADPAFMTWLGQLQNQRGQLIDIQYGLEHYVAASPPKYQPVYLHQGGLAFIYAAVWGLTGSMRYIYIQALQVIMDLANVVMLFLIGSRLFGSERVGLLTAGLYAVLPKAILYTAAPLDAWWVLTGLLIAVTLFIQVVDDPTKARRALVAVGLVAGLFAWIRGDMILVPVGAGIAAIPLIGWRRGLVYGILSVAIAYLVFAPWVVFQSARAGTFLPFGRTGAGQNLYEGLGDMSNPYGVRADDGYTLSQMKSEGYTGQYGTPSYDNLLLEKYFTFVGQHPAFVAEEVALRATYSWLVPYGSHHSTMTSSHLLSETVNLGSLAYSLLLGGLMLIGAWIGRRSIRRWGIVATVGLIWYVTLLPFHYQGRTSIPGLVLPNILLAAYALARGIDRWGPRQLRSAGRAGNDMLAATPIAT